MERSVVFKTKGKLDLRSIMTFGLNSKPNTGHPIGFFGTGLKYAIAVLTRHKIPVTIYIDGRKWVITTEESTFRDKSVTEVFLERHRRLLPPTIRKLPFTTELGKTWELWQAFRELHSNTLDENGETFVNITETEGYAHEHGQTLICVESEAFVEEFYSKDKTFLPNGLIQREGTESVQIFDRPSRHVYYRGIRVLDLKEEEASQLTYNILAPIELTEDRTAKSKWDVQYTIQAAVSSLEDKGKIEKVILAPKRSFEGSMNFYNAPSKTFLDVTSKAVVERSREVTHHAREVHKQYAPKPEVEGDWLDLLIEAIEKNWSDVVSMYIVDNRDKILDILKRERNHVKQLQVPKLRVHSDGDGEGKASSLSSEPGDQEPNTYATAGSIKKDDDIPF